MTTTEVWTGDTLHVSPAERQHDPNRLELAARRLKAAEADWDRACRLLDVEEGAARRGAVHRAELHAVRLREQGARDRYEQALRDHEELTVVQIVAEASVTLPELAEAADAAEARAVQALDEFGAFLLELNRARVKLDHDLNTATTEPGMRLRLAGLGAKYAALPQARSDPAGRLALLGEAARRRLTR